MPQAPMYLPDEDDPDDTHRLDNSKPETWPLFLPSAIPKDDRSACYKGIVETEQILRLAQMQDSLVDLRRFRRALRNLRLYFKTNMAGEGQKTQTKSRTIETSVNNRVKRAVRRYRTAYHALLELDSAGDWTNEYRELRDEDNRGPLKEAEETGTGDGRYIPSWIWAAPSAMALPGEGSAAEQKEFNETARHEWMTCRARADRWEEEEELLQEEMRRVVVYLEWKSCEWLKKVGVRASLCTPDIQHGVDAYARKQANIHREIAISFVSQWLPYLRLCGLETKWTAELPWISQVFSRKKKLPKWFPTPTTEKDDPRMPSTTGSPPDTAPTPTTKRDDLHVPSTTGSAPDAAVGLGVVQKHPDASMTQGEGGSHRWESGGGEHSDDDESSDDEEEDLDSEDEDRDDEGDDDEGACDNGAETNEFGFEYDDEYMS